MEIEPTAREPKKWYFVGALIPVGHHLPLLVGARLLVERTAASWVLVNTPASSRAPRGCSSAT